MTIEYRAGNIIPTHGSVPVNFIVKNKQGSLIYHSRAVWGDEPTHEEITSFYGVDRSAVVGCGSILRHDAFIAELRSFGFDGLPTQVLEGFAGVLLPEYQRFWPNLSEIRCRPSQIKLDEWAKSHSINV